MLEGGGDGPGVVQVDGAVQERLAHGGQGGFDAVAGGQDLRQDLPAEPDPGGGLPGPDREQVPQQGAGAGGAAAGGGAAQVDLAGGDDLGGGHPVAQGLQAAGQVELFLVGQLPVGAVDQLGQAVGHRGEQGVRLLRVGESDRPIHTADATQQHRQSIPKTSPLRTVSDHGSVTIPQAR